MEDRIPTTTHHFESSGLPDHHGTTRLMLSEGIDGDADKADFVGEIDQTKLYQDLAPIDPRTNQPIPPQGPRNPQLPEELGAYNALSASNENGRRIYGVEKGGKADGSDKRTQLSADNVLAAYGYEDLDAEKQKKAFADFGVKVAESMREVEPIDYKSFIKGNTNEAAAKDTPAEEDPATARSNVEAAIENGSTNGSTLTDNEASDDNDMRTPYEKSRDRTNKMLADLRSKRLAREAEDEQDKTTTDEATSDTPEESAKDSKPKASEIDDRARKVSEHYAEQLQKSYGELHTSLEEILDRVRGGEVVTDELRDQVRSIVDQLSTLDEQINRLEDLGATDEQIAELAAEERKDLLNQVADAGIDGVTDETDDTSPEAGRQPASPETALEQEIELRTNNLLRNTDLIHNLILESQQRTLTPQERQRAFVYASHILEDVKQLYAKGKLSEDEVNEMFNPEFINQCETLINPTPAGVQGMEDMLDRVGPEGNGAAPQTPAATAPGNGNTAPDQTQQPAAAPEAQGQRYDDGIRNRDQASLQRFQEENAQRIQQGDEPLSFADWAEKEAKKQHDEVQAKVASGEMPPLLPAAGTLSTGGQNPNGQPPVPPTSGSGGNTPQPPTGGNNTPPSANGGVHYHGPVTNNYGGGDQNHGNLPPRPPIGHNQAGRRPRRRGRAALLGLGLLGAGAAGGWVANQADLGVDDIPLAGSLLDRGANTISLDDDAEGGGDQQEGGLEFDYSNVPGINGMEPVEAGEYLAERETNADQHQYEIMELFRGQVSRDHDSSSNPQKIGNYEVWWDLNTASDRDDVLHARDTRTGEETTDTPTVLRALGINWGSDEVKEALAANNATDGRR